MLITWSFARPVHNAAAITVSAFVPVSVMVWVRVRGRVKLKG